MSNEQHVEAGAPIELTDAAAERVRALLAREANPAARLRVGVKGGGCSGLEYVLKLDANVRPNDIQLEVRGVPLLIDAKSLPYIKGSVLDYTGQLIGGGFRVNNPNASRTCGCGTSFTPAD
ncbi:MAG: iron-sulfur cluster assembly accessory protein [Fimbriimonadia bacterium]|jgi:iron-sulfur cluster assembly accessory protein